MNSQWIHQQKRPECILFFNGWGIDDNAVKHLFTSNYDVCMLSDYTVLSDFDSSFFKSYDQLHLIAWSLGVWSASKALTSTELSFSKTLAINGTLNPIDKHEGIDPQVFNSTITYWNDIVRTKFNRRILGGAKAYQQFYKRLGNRPVTVQKLELEALQQHIKHSGKVKNCFKKVLIGERDAIFLPSNQIKYWQSKSDYTVLDMAHYPFDQFESWDELLAL